MEGYILYEDKLKGEYKNAFETVSAYVDTVMVDEVTASEYLNELLDSFLVAQDEGKPVSGIVGNDMETFCRSFCADFSFKERLYKVWDYLKSVMWVIFWISLGDIFFTTDNIFTAKSDSNISGYIIGVMAVVVVTTIMNIVLSRVMFKSKKRGYKIVNIVSGVVAVVALGIFLWAFRADYLDFFSDVPAYIPTAIAAVFLIIYYAFNHKRRKEHKQNSVSLWQAINEMDDPEFADTMEKKRQKKHMEPAEFLKKEICETERMEKLGKCYWIGMVAVYLVSVFANWRHMESTVDGIIYVVIMAVVFYLITKFIYHINQACVRMRRNWVEEYRKNIEKSSLEDEKLVDSF